MKNILKIILGISLIVICVNSLYSQVGSRQIVTAAPFLDIPTSSSSLAMGNTGVAMNTQDGILFYNPSRILFSKYKDAFSVSIIPWLTYVSNEIKMFNLEYAYKPNDNSALAFGLNYFNSGNLILKDNFGTEVGNLKSNEFAISGTYALSIGYSNSIALTVKGFRSSLISTQAAAGYITANLKPTWGIAADISYFHKFELSYQKNLSLGINLKNLGPKVNYSSFTNKTYLPITLKIGVAYQTNIDEDNEIQFGIDINKYLVPTPPIYDDNGRIVKGKDPNRGLISGVFGSFSDAPDGFSEEIKEINYCIGAEYKYKDILAFRAGISKESKEKGNRNYIGLGIGITKSVFEQDFTANIYYLVPFGAASGIQSPFKNSYGISIIIKLNKQS